MAAIFVSPEFAQDIVPALTQVWALPMGGGTEKQIQFAKNLRQEHVAQVLDHGFEWYGRRHADQDAWRQAVIAAVIARVAKVPNAQFWIQNRATLLATGMGRDLTDILSAKS